MALCLHESFLSGLREFSCFSSPYPYIFFYFPKYSSYGSKMLVFLFFQLCYFPTYYLKVQQESFKVPSQRALNQQLAELLWIIHQTQSYRVTNVLIIQKSHL